MDREVQENPRGYDRKSEEIKKKGHTN